MDHRFSFVFLLKYPEKQLDFHQALIMFLIKSLGSGSVFELEQEEGKETD
jgi:hypothetical protein